MEVPDIDELRSEASMEVHFQNLHARIPLPFYGPDGFTTYHDHSGKYDDTSPLSSDTAEVQRLKLLLRKKTDELEAEKRVTSKLAEALKKWQPLAKVGCKVRQRFLELKARDVDRNEPEGHSPDSQIVEQGNHAASDGDFLADNALFTLGITSSDLHKRIFKQLYNNQPGINRWKQIPRLVEIVNLRATTMGHLTDGGNEARTQLRPLIHQFSDLELRCTKIAQSALDLIKEHDLIDYSFVSEVLADNDELGDLLLQLRVLGDRIKRDVQSIAQSRETLGSTTKAVGDNSASAASTRSYTVFISGRWHTFSHFMSMNLIGALGRSELAFYS